MDGSRNTSIDFWRGFALVTIAVNHVPGNPLEPLTHKNFGLSDAAELFVLLAGMAVVLAYGRGEGKAVPLRSLVRLGGRIRLIYMAHITTLVVAAALVCFAVQRTEDIRILEATQFDLLVATPLTAIVGIATLGLQPAYFNILPLYVVLMVLAPLFLVLVKWSRPAALAASAVLYVGAQALDLRLPSYPGDDAWFFNPLAWQVLFVAGMCLGPGFRPPARVHRALLPCAAAILVAGLVIVRADLYARIDLEPLPRILWDTDKTNLSLPRLAHVLALAYVVSRLPVGRWIAGSSWAGLLVAMGRHSLPVFCVGGILSLAIQLLRPALDAGEGVEIALVGCSLLAQVILAKVLEWNRGKSEVRLGSRVEVS